MINVVNSPVLTSYGRFNFDPITVAEAKNLLQGGFVSAIGHTSTAELLSVLLDIPIPINRVRVEMQPGDKALVFRLLERIEEGKILSRFELGLLERLPLIKEADSDNHVELLLPSGATIFFESK